MVTTSPVLNQPSVVQRSSAPSISVYADATQAPRTWSSPCVFPSHGVSRPFSSTPRTCTSAAQALLGAHLHLLVVGQVLHAGLEPRAAAERRHLGHAPGADE